MNDLPQNELFSAYLDGELTAAEQAEVERLLASSPAARQLLDDLRALSATLQALPQRKLGEDLSRQVLQAAEQRKHAEASGGEIESLPMPRRSLSERFLNRRTLAWVGLAVAIAVMISINERRQGVAPKNDVVREVAVARSSTEKIARKPGPPPSIQAVHDEDKRSFKEAKEFESSKGAKSEVAAESPPTSRLEEPVARPAAAVPPMRAEKAMPAYAPKAAEREAGKADEYFHRAKGGGLGGGDRESYSADKKKDATALPFGAAGAPRRLSKAAAKAAPPLPAAAEDASIPAAPAAPAPETLGNAKAANVAADAAGNVIPNTVVVRCEITPEAAKRRVFDKLLTANGIQPSQRRNQMNQMQQALNAAPQVFEQAKQEAKRQAGEKKPTASVANGEEVVIQIEATAAQIEATVAGLEALPDQFLSVSVDAGEGQQSLQTDNLARNQPQADGRERNSQLRGAMNTPSGVAQQPTIAQKAEMSQNRQDRAAQQLENRRNLQNQLQTQQMNQSVVQQRAMFVLRVVEGQRPTAAAAIKARNSAEADAAKQPAAAPPAEMPAKH